MRRERRRACSRRAPAAAPPPKKEGCRRPAGRRGPHQKAPGRTPKRKPRSQCVNPMLNHKWRILNLNPRVPAVHDVKQYVERGSVAVASPVVIDWPDGMSYAGKAVRVIYDSANYTVPNTVGGKDGSTPARQKRTKGGRAMAKIL